MIKSLIKVGVFTLVIVFLIAIASILAYEARRRGKMTYCQNNLRNLGNIAFDVIKDARRNNEKIQERGSGFWMKSDFLAEWIRRKENNLDVLICPLTGNFSSDKTKPQYVDYRGPKLDPTEYKRNEPLGADKVGNHGKGMGGNVLLLDLSVESSSPQVTNENNDSLIWRKADETTSE